MKESAGADDNVEISAIIPVGGRHATDLLALYADYKSALDALGVKYEVIVVLDGPRPELAADVQRLLASGASIAVIGLTRRFGEATALVAGFQRARGRTIVTLPAYHQIRGSEIGRLVRALGVVDLAIGRRWPRVGGRFEALRRDLFHRMLAAVTGQRLHDLGCGARAMKRRVLEEITLYGDQHRFLPVLASRNGFKVMEIELQQSPLDRFAGGYKLREYVRRALDICTVFFLVRFTKKPLRFFGMVGVSTSSSVRCSSPGWQSIVSCSAIRSPTGRRCCSPRSSSSSACSSLRSGSWESSSSLRMRATSRIIRSRKWCGTPRRSCLRSRLRNRAP